MIEPVNMEGLIPIFGGAYAYLLGAGILPRNPKNPEEMELWRRKYGTMMKCIGPLLIIYGAMRVGGVF